MANYEPGPRFDKRKFRKVIGEYMDANIADIGLNSNQRTGLKKAITLRGEKNSPFTGGTAKRINSSSTTSAVSKSGFDVNSVAERASNVAPFLSNVVNAFRRPPRPIAPQMVSAVTMTKPSLANERREIDRTVEGLNRNADATLDANTAASVRTASTIQGLRAKGQSYQNEANIGAQVNNQGSQINAQINMENMRKIDSYNQDKVGMQIAHQRESSANVANAADKFVQIEAAKDARELDRQKFDVVSKAFSNSNVTNRLVRQILGKKQGDTLTDEDYNKALQGAKYRLGGLLKKYPFGGLLGNEDPKKKVFRSQDEVNAANAEARRFATAKGYASGEDTYVARKPGDAVPLYMDSRTGKEFVPAPVTKAKYNVPNNVNLSDIKSDGSSYWYEDPHTGDIVDVDSSVLNLPRFKKTKETVAQDLQSRQMALKANGGLLAFEKLPKKIRVKDFGKHEGSIPPEMMSQYLRLGGKIMHTPKMKGRIRKVY